MFRPFDLRLRLTLMRRFAEDSFKQANEVEVRKTCLPSHLVDRDGILLPVTQQIAGTAKAT